jgi:hypothetical protein
VASDDAAAMQGLDPSTSRLVDLPAYSDPVIFISGYSLDCPTDRQVLAKPFHPSDLLAAVERVCGCGTRLPPLGGDDAVGGWNRYEGGTGKSRPREHHHHGGCVLACDGPRAEGSGGQVRGVQGSRKGQTKDKTQSRRCKLLYWPFVQRQDSGLWIR